MVVRRERLSPILREKATVWKLSNHIAIATLVVGLHHARLATLQGWKTCVCPKLSSSTSSKKESAIVILQESVTRTSWRSSLQRRESTWWSWQQEASTETVGAHQWEKPVVSSRQRGLKSQMKDAGGRRASSIPNILRQTFVCPKCGRFCAPRIGLYSHQGACRNWLSTFPKILVCEESANIITVWGVNKNLSDCFKTVLSHWNFSPGKFGLLSPG